MLVPLDGLLNNLPTVNAARVSLGRIEGVMAEFGALRTVPPASDAPDVPPAGAVTLRGVTHAYFHERDERMFRIGPIDLTIRPGELVFIVGGNGSGKTTLAKVLTGLYEPEEGTIEVDGRTIGWRERAAYRQRFSAVFNDFHLFDALLGIVDPDDPARTQADARANALVAKLALDHKVKVVDGAFSNRALSTGQRKRLALVVAYLEDRPFYLFDEWAADQDPVFRHVFYTELLADLKRLGKTIIVISHDDRYFHCADRVVRLRNGRLDEDDPDQRRDTPRSNRSRALLQDEVASHETSKA